MKPNLVIALLLAVLASNPAAASSFKLLATQGEVTIERQGDRWQAASRQSLEPGDVVQTAPGGSASVMTGGSIIYLGEAARLAAYETGAAGVTEGRLRIVNCQSERPLQIATPMGIFSLQQGVFNLRVGPSGAHLESEQGTATIKRRPSGLRQVQFSDAETPPEQLETGESAVIPNPDASAGELEEEDERRLDVEDLQQQAADDAGQAADTTTPDDAQRSAAEGDIERRRQPDALSIQPAFGSLSASFAGLSASFGGSASGGANSDANQATLQGMRTDNGNPFPGNIHLVTTDSRYTLDGVTLQTDEKNAIFGALNNPVYFSITEGVPTAQVFTDFLTATDAPPRVVAIPGTDNAVIKFTQYGLPDATLDPAAALNNPFGITGLLGDPPSAPAVFNATPSVENDVLSDPAVLNKNATFALGEFRLRLDDGDDVELSIRRSDQDRLIVKDPGGNDALDKVTPKPGVVFEDFPDPRFQPAAPTVKRPVPQFDPNVQDPGTRFSNLSRLRRAAATTVVADELNDFARRTGQTRFVVDGRIIDISGYQKQP